MLDQTSPHNPNTKEPTAGRYDLVVVGAGIAGLNTLHAALDYLPEGAKALLVDQKNLAGGMWNTAYDYVRLHQPHPMFTVGDLTWNWQKPATYLARRDEVRDHLAGALKTMSERTDLEIRFGHTVTACDEVQTAQGPRVRIAFHPNDDPGSAKTVEAPRAIYASGLNYHAAAPLALSSTAVLSIVPQDLRATLRANPGAPVIVVGGGKTGMDTILETLADDPGRAVSLINGPGTNFMNRTKYAPTGLRRWTTGDAFSRLLRDIALQFDGDNEDATMEHFRRHHATDPDSPNAAFLFGFQSEDEHASIAAGVHRTYADYLADVVDTADGPRLEMRSGARETVEPGSIVVNCTGSFFRTDHMADRLPCLSPQGTILRINQRDGLHYHTSVAGFFSTHLFCRGELRGLGLYTLDHEALFRRNRQAFVGAVAAQAYMFHVTMVQTLPMPVLNSCRLDLDRWYPLPRRLAWFFRLKQTADSDLAHCRKVLDRVADRFDIHCAPLV